MRTAADCFNDLRRIITTGEPVAREQIESLVNEAHGLGCDIAIAGILGDLDRIMPAQAWTACFGKRAFADTAQYRIGDAQTVIFPN